MLIKIFLTQNINIKYRILGFRFTRDYIICTQISTHFIIKMEQFAKLPQIRISLLEQIISNKKQNHNLNQRNQGASLNPFIKIATPFYNRNRSIHHGLCHHLKCHCRQNKNSKDNICSNFIGSKMGKNTHKGHIIPSPTARHKTEGSQLNNQMQGDRKSNEYFGRYVEGEVRKSLYGNFQQNASNLYKKIEKELKTKILNKYGISSDDPTTRSRIQQFLISEYSNQWSQQNNRSEKQSKQKSWKRQKLKTTLQRRKQKLQYKDILKNVQKFVRQNMVSDLKHDENTAISEIRRSSDYGKSKRKQKRIGIKKRTIKIKNNQKIDIADILLNKDVKQQMIDDFVEQMMKLDIDEFSQKLIDIDDAVQQCEGQDKIWAKKTLKNIVESFNNKIQQKTKGKGIEKTNKEQMLRKVNKLFTGTGNEIDESQKQNKLVATQPNFFSKKYLSIKKSQKTFRLLAEYDQMSEAPATQKFLTSVSLAEALGSQSRKKINNNYQQERLSILQDLKSQQIFFNRTRSTFNIKQGKYSTNFGFAPYTDKIFENYSEKGSNISSETSEVKKRKSGIVGKQKNEEQNQSPQVQRKSKRNIESVNLFDDKFEEYRGQTNKDHTVSKFKIQKEEQLRILKQKIQKEQCDIRSFMLDNKSIKLKGIARLRQEHFDNLIIQQSDSLFTKKKKIRKIKELIQTLEQSSRNIEKQDMMKELLAYINIYEMECELIIKRGIKDSNINESADNFQQRFQLFDENCLKDDLKFVKLNDDFIYGEQDEWQFKCHEEKEFLLDNIKSTKNIALEIYKEKVWMKNENQKIQELCQKEVPEMGHEELISSVSTAPGLSHLRTKSGYRRKLRGHAKTYTENLEQLRDGTMKEVWRERSRGALIQMKTNNIRGQRKNKREQDRVDRKNRKGTNILLTQNTLNDMTQWSSRKQF